MKYVFGVTVVFLSFVAMAKDSFPHRERPKELPEVTLFHERLKTLYYKKRINELYQERENARRDFYLKKMKIEREAVFEVMLNVSPVDMREEINKAQREMNEKVITLDAKIKLLESEIERIKRVMKPLEELLEHREQYPIVPRLGFFIAKK